MQDESLPGPAPDITPAAATAPPKRSLDDALALMRDLRARCEWDAAQTHASLRPYLVEEAAEVDHAIAEGDDGTLRDELGDLLLQVLFHAVVAEERGAFDIADVSGALVAKMRARHPHLYGDGVKRPWEAMKARTRRTIDEGLAPGLPALHRAHRLQDRAGGVGFDWPDLRGPLAKIREELDEVAAHVDATGSIRDAAALEAEIGDLLFAVVALARKANVHASLALDATNRTFVRRLQTMERLAAAAGHELQTLAPDAQQALWQAAKAAERGGDAPA